LFYVDFRDGVKGDQERMMTREAVFVLRRFSRRSQG
jgi:hypothetical protein